MRKTVTVLALVLTVAGSPGLIAQSRQEQQMAAELRMLQEQQQLLALAVAQLAESLKAVNPRFDEVTEAFRKRMADVELTIRNMGNDLSAIRSQAQDAGTRLGSLADEVDAIHKALASLPAQLAQLLQPGAGLPPADAAAAAGSASAGAPPLSPPPAAPALPLPPSTAGVSPGQLLGQAKGDYFAGQYDAAVSGFETVIRNFPGTQTAAEAQYYIGESHFRAKRFGDAIAAYDAVIQTYPKFVQVPDAYYKRGLSQEGAGLMDEARATFEFAMKNYADTTPGQLAKQGYERVTRQAPPARR